MNEKMAFFLFEVSQKGIKMQRNRGVAPSDVGVFNPYPQFPSWKHSGLSPMDKHFIREHGSGYRLYPEHTRQGFGGAAATLVRATPVTPILALTGIPVATFMYTDIASAQYQSAMTGQPTASDPRLLSGGKQGLSYFRF
jgi:hypothetical protein